MEKALIVILLIRGFYSHACGDPPMCTCTPNLGLITCKGIEKFPRFNLSEIWNIDMLDIRNTSLHKLPNLDDWANLAMLTVVDNPYLDCSELLYEGYRFFVNSDCPIMSDPLVEVQEEINWPYFLSIIPLAIIALAGGYKAIRDNVRRSRFERRDEERAGQKDIYESVSLEEGQSSERWQSGRIE